MEMEDVLEGVVVPHWSFGSVVLLLLVVLQLVVVCLVVVEAVRWFRAVRREDGGVRSRMGWIIGFVLLVLTSAQRGWVYFRGLFQWIYLVLRIDTTPGLDLLQMGCIIQEGIWLEALRALSHIVLYGVAYCVIRSGRERVQRPSRSFRSLS